MATRRLYTRTQDLRLFQQCLIALDLTRRDFPSDPRLDFYVKRWFVDLDDLMDFLSSTVNQSITLITSHLLADITCRILRPIYPQIVQIMIIGEPRDELANVKYFSDVQVLVDHLSSALRNRRRLHITFHTWPVERTSYNLTQHTGQFLWYMYFYHRLSHLESTGVAREELLESIQIFHSKQIDEVQRSCEEFRRSYHPRDILQWYTRASFLYLLLNRTLRSQDINHILAMRCVISDLERSIQTHDHQKHLITTVYRGQQIHTFEIAEIEANVGGLIGLTAFWSTSRSKEVALEFTELWPPERTDSVEGVLFSIQIPSHVEQSFYLDASSCSTSDFEMEVLFSFRSIFRVERVMKNGHDQCWYVDLTLIDYQDEQYRAIMQSWYFLTKDIIGHRSFFTPPSERSRSIFTASASDNGPFLQFHLLLDMILRLDQNQICS